MPHVSFVALSGVRIQKPELLELGLKAPDLASRAAAIQSLPPLGLLTLAALTPDHWTKTLHEVNLINDDLVQQIVNDQPDLVAVSALTASIEEAYLLCDRLRKQNIRTVIGGLHVTSCPDEAATHADVVIIGDGEPSWNRVLADFEQGLLQTFYRAEAPFHLDQSPIPNWDLLHDKRRIRYTLQTQRGCPLACEFCGASRLLGPFRQKPLDAIDRELIAIRSFCTNPVIELADDNTFIGNRDWDRWFDLFARHNVRYFTETDWRVGENKPLLERLSLSGCVQLLIGIESIEPRYDGMGAKQSDIQRIVDAVEAIQDRGIAVIGCFVVGADNDTPESIDRLTQFLIDSPLADIQVTLQTPFPGTPLYKRLNEEGRLLQERSWSSYTLFDLVYQPKQMSVDELEDSYKKLIEGVYSQGNSRGRIERRRQIWAKRKKSDSGNSSKSK